MSTQSRNRTLILHLDDDPFEHARLAKLLESSGDLAQKFEVHFFDSCLKLLKTPLLKEADAVVLDIDLGTKSKESGVDIIPMVRSVNSRCAILMSSFLDQPDYVLRSVKAGADDFLSKNSDVLEASLRILKCIEERKSAIEGEAVKLRFAGQSMINIATRVPRILSSAIRSILVYGESGTGKEVVADLFEEALKKSFSFEQKERAFVRVNCAALSPTLLESELFGHVRGSFTGAHTDRVGLIEASQGGWLFLDEIATLSTQAQATLLRALESREIVRVGASKPVKVNFRLIAATNEKLEDLVKEKKFRGDLWQRIKEAEIELPPLRERREEIPALIDLFLSQMEGGPYRVSVTARNCLLKASWSNGNVRELRNCLRSMTEFAGADKLLTPKSLPHQLVDELSRDESAEQPADFVRNANGHSFHDKIDLLLLRTIQDIQLKEGKPLSLRELSRKMGIARSTLSDRLKVIRERGSLNETEQRQISFS